MDDRKDRLAESFGMLPMGRKIVLELSNGRTIDAVFLGIDGDSVQLEGWNAGLALKDIKSLLLPFEMEGPE